MSVRAKMKLATITDRKYSVSSSSYKTLRFEAQYDPAIPEDRRFQQATPIGHIEMQIDNPAALAQFELGADYYVDFTPVPAPSS